MNLLSKSKVFAENKLFATLDTTVRKVVVENLPFLLSDTVGFKSSTTTQNDQDYAEELAKIAGITDLNAFTLEILKAKSDISNLTPTQIVKNDYKIFDFFII